MLNTPQIDLITIIIPILNEEDHILPLIQSLENQDFPLDKMEILLIDGGSIDRTLEIIEDRKKNSNLNLLRLHNERKIPASALNMGLQYANGDIIVRLDVHCTYELSYVKKVVSCLMENHEACNVGGVTTAVGYDFWSNSIAAVQNSPFGVGGASFRYAAAPIESDTVFPGVWWKKDLLHIGGWDEECVGDEDGELNIRLKKITRQKIVVYPNIKLFYYPRNTIYKLCKQYFRYGYWRIKTFKKHPYSIRLTHVIPPLFIFSLITLGLLSSLHSTFRYIFLGESMLYLLSIMYCSYKIKRGANMFAIFLSFITVHFSWGIGAFFGYLKFGFPLKGYLHTLSKITSNKMVD